MYIWVYGWKSINKKFLVVKKSELYRINVINMLIDLKDLILWYINNCNILFLGWYVEGNYWERSGNGG